MHRNNFDFLRLVFALTVLVTHSYALICTSELDFLGHWTDSQVVLSYLGVRGFFIISGYLIYQSMLRSRDLVDFFWKRALRLWPGLLVVLTLSLLLAPLVYDGSDGPYWLKRDVWTYIPMNATLYALQPDIAGVFPHNPFTKSINGSLWTICHEFTCYMMLGAMIFLRRWPQVVKAVMIVAALVLLVTCVGFADHFAQKYFFLNIGVFLELALFFLAGSLLAAFGFERVPYKSWIALAATAALVVITILGHFRTGFHFVLLPVAVIAVGVQATPVIDRVGERLGDMSYGIYIYGFPVQQTIEHLMQPDQPTMLAISLPITVVLGWLSWHLVEKRALRWKNRRPTAWIERKLGWAKG